MRWRKKEDARVLNLINHRFYSSAIILSAWKERERNGDRHIDGVKEKGRKKKNSMKKLNIK